MQIVSRESIKIEKTLLEREVLVDGMFIGVNCLGGIYKKEEKKTDGKN